MCYKSKIGEECGVFAIYDPKGHCAQSTYYGLYALQHRGQESCGIAVNKDRDIYHHKDMGLVNEVFTKDILDNLEGTMAVGHVRYSTTGGSMRENAQPLVLRYAKGNIALAHNGNLMNKLELIDDLSRTGAIFQTTTDTETIAYMIARQRIDSPSIEVAVEKTISRLVGAFSLIVMSPTKLIAVRDPWGFRPLCMGRKGDAVIFASESCAIDSIGAEFVRDVEPGEIIVVQGGKIKTIDTYKGSKQKGMCIFEYIYFARPDSVIEGQNAHESRMLAGKYLALQKPVEADIVIGVPDSGISAALGYSLQSGIPYGLGFIKNKYIGRTFIQPSQSMREDAVRIKLNVLKETVAGKRVVMIDDSIVRGTTSKHIVNLLREAGAREVHVRSSSPPFMWPCYFGTDIPSRDQLIACNHSIDEIRDIINADSLEFLSLESLEKITPNTAPGFCTGCFSGKYPVDVNIVEEKEDD